MRKEFLIGALAFALLGASSDAPDDGSAPPAGIVPVKTTLAAVLAMHRKALGRLTPGLPKTISETWSVHSEGLDGVETTVASDKDQRTDSTFGPIHAASGTLAGRGWHQNESGEVVVEHALHHMDDITSQALVEQNRSVSLLGAVTSPVDAYVVKIAPTGGRLEYLFYSRATGLLVRREASVRGRRTIGTFDDFRTTDGVTRAWHIHDSDGRASNDDDYKLTSLANGKPIDPKLLAIPVSTTPVALSSPKVTIPIKILGDRVIVPTTIGGHTVDFQLDSGAAQILVDDAVVDALKLKTYGGGIGDTAGSYRAASTIIPKMTFGGVTMTDVHAESAPFTFWGDSKTPVAGLLGFDFIAGAVLRIDYIDKTLEAYDANTFVPPTGSIAIPISLDDNVPLVSAGIAKATGHLFIVDTGADNSALFSAFVSAHPEAVHDMGLGDELSASYPFVTAFGGVGGDVQYRSLQVGPFAFGPYVFPRWLFLGIHDAPAFEDDFDGLIGQDFLRNFDVYLDYAHEKIWLVPNARYNARWG